MDRVGRLEKNEGYPIYGTEKALIPGVGVSQEAFAAQKTGLPGLGPPEADGEVPRVSVGDLSINGDVLVCVQDPESACVFANHGLTGRGVQDGSKCVAPLVPEGEVDCYCRYWRGLKGCAVSGLGLEL